MIGAAKHCQVFAPQGGHKGLSKMSCWYCLYWVCINISPIQTAREYTVYPMFNHFQTQISMWNLWFFNQRFTVHWIKGPVVRNWGILRFQISSTQVEQAWVELWVSEESHTHSWSFVHTDTSDAWYDIWWHMIPVRHRKTINRQFSVALLYDGILTGKSSWTDVLVMVCWLGIQPMVSFWTSVNTDQSLW